MKSITSIKAPKGFYFKVTKRTNATIKIGLHLTSDHVEIGHINLVPFGNKNYLQTHSYLHCEFRGQKLGALLYAKAIKWGLDRGYGVRSSGNSSECAIRVWKGNSLRKFFNIKRRDYYPGNFLVTETYYAYNKE